MQFKILFVLKIASNYIVQLVTYTYCTRLALMSMKTPANSAHSCVPAQCHFVHYTLRANTAHSTLKFLSRFACDEHQRHIQRKSCYEYIRHRTLPDSLILQGNTTVDPIATLYFWPSVTNSGDGNSISCCS